MAGLTQLVSSRPRTRFCFVNSLGTVPKVLLANSNLALYRIRIPYRTNSRVKIDNFYRQKLCKVIFAYFKNLVFLICGLRIQEGCEINCFISNSSLIAIKNKMNQIAHRAVIGYPSVQDWAIDILPTRATRRVPREKFPQKPNNKSLIDQAFWVKMAGLALLSFCEFMDLDSFSVHKHAKKKKKKKTWPISSQLDLILGQ